MMERSTDRARKVMEYAREEAGQLSQECVGPEHILLGLVKEGSGVGACVLRNLGVDIRKVRTEIEKIAPRGASQMKPSQLPLSPSGQKVMALAAEEGTALGHNYIGTEHILLGLVRDQEGSAARVLVALGLELDRVREEVLKLLGGQGGTGTIRGEAKKIIERVMGQRTFGHLSLTPRAEKTLDLAAEEAKKLEHPFIGTGHIFLGLLQEKDNIVARALVNLGVKLDEVRREVLRLLQGRDV